MKKFLASIAKFLSALAGGGLTAGLTQAFGVDPEMSLAATTVVMGLLTYAVPNAKAD